MLTPALNLTGVPTVELTGEGAAGEGAAAPLAPAGETVAAAGAISKSSLPGVASTPVMRSQDARARTSDVKIMEITFREKRIWLM